jgi:hypothetical protein
MGLFGGLFKEKRKEARVEKIDFAQLPAWLADHRKRLESGLDECATPLVKSIPDLIRDIQDSLSALEKAGMQKDVHQRIKAVVSSSRDNYVSKTRKLLGEIELAGGPVALAESLKKALNGIHVLDVRYGERAKFGFEKDVSAVRKGLTELAAAFEGLNVAISERREKLRIIGEAQELLKRIGEANSGLRETEGREKKEAGSSKEDEKGAASKQREIEELESGERAKRLAALKSASEKLRQRKQEIETSVLNILGPLKRPLKKYAKAVEEGRASGFVGKYGEDPAETYLRGDNTLPDLLARVQKAILGKTITLDEGEDEKTVKKMRGISFSYLETAREEHMDICRRLRKLDVQAAELDISRELEKLRQERDSLKEKAAEESKNAGKIDEELKAKKSELDSLNKKLVEKLSEFIGGRCELGGPPA